MACVFTQATKKNVTNGCIQNCLSTFMKWLLNIFKPKIVQKHAPKIPTIKFGSWNIETGEFSEGYITSNGKMAYRRVGKWTEVNNKMAP